MISVLLATTITCAEGAWIMQGLQRTQMPEQERTDLAEEIIRAMPADCTVKQYEGVLQ